MDSSGQDSSRATAKVTIALNGRKGRRIGCVCIGDGREIEVLDMDHDEDAEVDNVRDERADSEMDGMEDA